MKKYTLEIIEDGKSKVGVNTHFTNKIVLHALQKKLIKEFQSRGIKVLVYESPMYYKHFKPQIQRRKQIDSFCQQLNIPFIDLNLETFLTKKPQYFENTTTKYQHLTSEGADAVSKILANKIVQLKLLSKNKN